MRPRSQSLRRKPPHAGEGGIVQPDAAVAGEHGDAFGEVVERFALHADQFLEPPLQIEPLGHVVEQIGDAAVRIGRGDDAQRAAVGQMPGVLLRLDGAVGGVQLRLPLPEVPLLGQLARGAQRVEHRRIGRPLIEIARRPDSTARDRRHYRTSAGDRRRTWRRRWKADRACGDAHRPCGRARCAWFPLPWRRWRARRCRSRCESRARRSCAAFRRRSPAAGRHRRRRRCAPARCSRAPRCRAAPSAVRPRRRHSRASTARA